MKTGTPSQGKPTMSARPPVRSSASMLEDLERVSDITEAPSRAAAQALAEGGAAPPPQEPAAAAPKSKPAKGRAPMPWDNLNDPGVTQQINCRLPQSLLAKLKFLGETTYGESQTSIIKKSLEETIAKMLKERGLS